jgi:hypothetical protein
MTRDRDPNIMNPACQPERKTNNPATKLKLLRQGLASLASLLGQEVLVDVGKDTTLGDGDVSEKLVQLLIVPDGELQVTGDDTGLLVVAGGVASQFEDFGGQVLEDSGQVDGRTGTDTLGVVSLTEETVDTADGERETSLRRTRLRVLGTARLATGFAAASHFDGCFRVKKTWKVMCC